jgi:hypothetical protein
MQSIMSANDPKRTYDCLAPAPGGGPAAGTSATYSGSRWPVWFTLRNGTLKLSESFTEGSKNVRHLPRYLSIQRDPEFFSAYHH